MSSPQDLLRASTTPTCSPVGLGAATVFVPVSTPIAEVGRVRVVEIPAVDLAVTVHHGSHDDIDRAYGSLATYVAESAISLDGPIRETYLTSFRETLRHRPLVDRDRLAHLPPRHAATNLTEPATLRMPSAAGPS